MRNIYEIIAEQKLITDINIASYDLQASSQHLLESDGYIQEGVGESLKNAGKKIIEFIKTIIRKIKELIQKVIRFFFKKKNDVKELENQIKVKNGEAPKKEDKSDIKEDKKEDKSDIKEDKKEDKSDIKEDKKEDNLPATRNNSNVPATRNNSNVPATRNNSNVPAVNGGVPKQARNLEDLLRKAKVKVRVKNFASLTKKMDFSKLFFRQTKEAVDQMKQNRLVDKDIIEELIIHKVFTKKAGSGNRIGGGNGEDTLAGRIADELGEGGERDVIVSEIADDMFDYFYRGEGAITFLEAMDKNATDEANKLIKAVEGKMNNAPATDDAVSRGLEMVRKTANLISQFVNAITKSIYAAADSYFQIAYTIVAKYK